MGSYGKYIPHVTPNTLLAIAGVVWMMVGGNILRIGLADFLFYWHDQTRYLRGAIMVFLIFMCLIFSRLVRKNHSRILNMAEEKVMVFRFFDRKSYFIMTFMIVGSMMLRHSHVLPGIVIGVLYLGIGSALVGSGVLFLQKFYLTTKGK